MPRIVRLLSFADLFSCEDLKQSAERTVERELTAVYHQEAGLQLSRGLLIAILSADSLNIAKEETVGEAAVLWLEYSTESRSQYLSSVLSQIRTDALSEVTQRAWLPGLPPNEKEVCGGSRSLCPCPNFSNQDLGDEISYSVIEKRSRVA